MEEEALSQRRTLAPTSSPREPFYPTHTTAPYAEPPLGLSHNPTVGLSTVSPNSFNIYLPD